MNWTVLEGGQWGSITIACECMSAEPAKLVDNNDEVTEILKGGIATLKKQGSPDKVRDYLVKNKVVGQRSTSRGCVMAEYFNTLLRDNDIDLAASVSGLTVMAVNPKHYREHSTRIELPTTISALVSQFDHGEYPELDVEFQALLDAEQWKPQLVNA